MGTLNNFVRVYSIAGNFVKIPEKIKSFKVSIKAS